MPHRSDHNHLLTALRNLYSKLMARILHRRIQDSPQYTHVSDTHRALEPFKQHISRIGEKSASEKVVNASSQAEAQEPKKKKIKPSKDYVADKGLSNYFNRNLRSKTSQPQLSQQMRNATQHHIGMALNLAHKGDMDNAHMHLDLANNALHMAEHYMSEEEYQTFHDELETGIKAIQEEMDKAH